MNYTDVPETHLSRIVSSCKRDKVSALKEEYTVQRQAVLRAVQAQFEETRNLYMGFAYPSYGERYTIETSRLRLTWTYKPITSTQPCEIDFLGGGENPPKDLAEATIETLLDLSERLVRFEQELDQDLQMKISKAKEFLSGL